MNKEENNQKDKLNLIKQNHYMMKLIEEKEIFYKLKELQTKKMQKFKHIFLQDGYISHNIHY